MADYTTSEHARLLLVEATLLLRDQTDERSEALYDSIAVALKGADVADLIARLACTAAEGWAHFAKVSDVPVVDMLQVVLANWGQAEAMVSALTEEESAGDRSPVPSG